MDGDTVRDYCASRKGASAEYPFGPGARVYKVLGKMFALVSDDEPSVNLKCDPVLAEVLRETYPAVRPGYHMNKRHWNTVDLDGDVPDAELVGMIDHSYELVVKGLSKVARERLAAM